MKKKFIDSGIIDHYSITDDLNLINNINEDEVLIRFWQLDAVILGKLDTLLPQFEKAKNYLRKLNYKIEIRKQGGLAIVSDQDNLNISFIFKAQSFKDLHKPYRCVANYIASSLSKLGLHVDIKSINESYCPGDYDLSINGLKVAGIAQYRNREAIIVSVNLFVKGDQVKRSTLLKDFYNIAEAHHSLKQSYPEIDINCMSTLSDVLVKEVSIDVVKEVLCDPKLHICE